MQQNSQKIQETGHKSVVAGLMLFYQKNIWIIFPFYIKETDILLYILTRIKKWRNVIVILKGKLANRNLLDEELIGISSREMKMASYPAIHQIFGVSFGYLVRLHIHFDKIYLLERVSLSVPPDGPARLPNFVLIHTHPPNQS